MLIDTKSLVSISEANRNFSQVARLVDKRGSVVVMRNNTPSYVILTFDEYQQHVAFNDAEATALGQQIIRQHRNAFDQLAQ